jgi:hypothetical protein
MANRSAELEAYPNHHNQQLAIMQVYFENLFFKKIQLTSLRDVQ